MKIAACGWLGGSEGARDFRYRRPMDRNRNFFAVTVRKTFWVTRQTSVFGDIYLTRSFDPRVYGVEGVEWIRGHHAADSDEVKAMKVAYSLRYG